MADTLHLAQRTQALAALVAVCPPMSTQQLILTACQRCWDQAALRLVQALVQLCCCYCNNRCCAPSRTSHSTGSLQQPRFASGDTVPAASGKGASQGHQQGGRLQQRASSGTPPKYPALSPSWNTSQAATLQPLYLRLPVQASIAVGPGQQGQLPDSGFPTGCGSGLCFKWPNWIGRYIQAHIHKSCVQSGRPCHSVDATRPPLCTVPSCLPSAKSFIF